MTALVDLTGKRFGRLVVESRDLVKVNSHIRWLCRCDCGDSTIVRGDVLRRGEATSCGCYIREVTSGRSTLHGLYGSPEYKAVISAHRRCTLEHDPNYANYGGRGIEYRLPDNPGDAAALLIDAIGRRPEGLSLDRIDVNGHYEIGNLRWATPSEQAFNRRPRATVALMNTAQGLHALIVECNAVFERDQREQRAIGQRELAALDWSPRRYMRVAR